MENERRAGKVTGPTYGVGWLAAPLALVALDMLLELFDTSTQISPDQENVVSACLAAGGIGALLFLAVALFGTQRMKAWQRVCLATFLPIIGFLSVFLLSSRVATLVENHFDFPARSTKTYTAFLRINRAYRTQGKGESWNIQTAPIWSNLDITEGDYRFMLSHRRPGDEGHNPNEISSKGYFCAKVTMEQSGDALRILNAGSHKLPAGTVVICPVDSIFPGSQ